MLGLFAEKLVEELDVSVLWVELLRTIILAIKLRSRVDLNRDHRFSRDTCVSTKSVVSIQVNRYIVLVHCIRYIVLVSKEYDAVARLAVYNYIG